MTYLKLKYFWWKSSEITVPSSFRSNQVINSERGQIRSNFEKFSEKSGLRSTWRFLGQFFNEKYFHTDHIYLKFSRMNITILCYSYFADHNLVPPLRIIILRRTKHDYSLHKMTSSLGNAKKSTKKINRKQNSQS